MQKCAFVSIIGRPSVGKSTLLNKMCGEKVSIISTVPQTTRNAIRGIVNRENGQLIFVDTPGRHVSNKKINLKLMEVSDRSIQDSDLVLYVLDASRIPGQEECEIAERLKSLSNKTIIAINKIDHQSANIEKIKEFLSQNILQDEQAKQPIFNVSAFTGDGIEELINALISLAPEGQPLYDKEYYTDQETGFRISEIIREKAINRLHQELPHSLYVEIADMEFKEDKLWVRAFIIVERESQKGMVVGKGGEMIKSIRLAALKDLKRIFDWKIDLDLRVKTGKDWRSRDHLLKKLIV